MKVTPVKGTNDYLPKEVVIRDYLQQKILSFYVQGSIPRGAFACFLPKSRDIQVKMPY